MAHKRWLPLLSCAVLAAAVALRADVATRALGTSSSAADVTRADDLAKQAYQILKTNCFECHGAAKRSGLDMRTHASITAGGSKGRVIVPHKPEESLLYKFATQEHEIKMPPPPRERVNESDLDILRQWIEAGGSLESVEEATTAQKNAEELLKAEERQIKPTEREYWAFKTPVRAPLPQPKTPGWNTNAIDAFLAGAMEAKGLKPSGLTDRRTLIRRAYLDVIGLPPSQSQGRLGRRIRNLLHRCAKADHTHLRGDEIAAAAIPII